MERCDCVVIGAGVVGLAVARALALAGREVVIVEQAFRIGSGISSRNSEVIHAGIYYPQGSLKARLCVAGREALYSYAVSRGVPHKRCGKLIVAPSNDPGGLEKIAVTALANGVDDLRWLDAADVRALEPELTCGPALLSPSTGIIDAHALMVAYLGDAEAAGAMIAYGTRVTEMTCHRDGVDLAFNDDAAPSLGARLVVNCAGLDAPALATAAGLNAPRPHYAKGNYFALTGRSPFSRLIYPMPEPGGLGIHLTLDLDDQARFGPDVEWVDRPLSDADYNVDPARGAAFYTAIRRYWPRLRDGQLAPAYAGIRPKIAGPGEPDGDFIVDQPPGRSIINLFGIESPGLTASLAIADEVAQRAREMLQE